MRPLLLAASVPALLIAAGGAAFAHAILVQSTPLDRGTVPAGEQSVVLRYNSRIDHARSRLTLDGTNAQMVLPLDKDAAADSLAAKVNLTPGNYVMRWQVLAIDGHMTRGDVRFTVAPK